MKRYLLLILLLSSMAFAQTDFISINIRYDKNTAAPLQQLPFTITVFNPANESVPVQIQVVGQETGWATLKDYKLTVGNKSTADTVLYVQPPKDAIAGAYSFTVSAFVETNPNITDKETFTLNVIASEQIKLLVSTDRGEYLPLEDLKIIAELENFGTIAYPYLTITYSLAKDGSTVWTDSETVSSLLPNKLVNLSYSKSISNTYLPGLYTVFVSVSDGEKQLIQKSVPVIIKEKRDIAIDQRVDDKFMRKNIVYTVENRGNVPEIETISLKFSWLESQFLSSSEKYETQKGVFTWKLTVQPGEVKTLRISTYGKVLFLVYMLFVLILLLSLYISYKAYKSRPKLEMEKRISAIHVGKKYIELSIALIIRNKSKEKMENIFLTDSVPKDVEVQKFTTINPSQINERELEIEYIWSLDKMLPLEERVIVYRLKTDIKEVTLPSASVQARNELGKLYFARSGKVSFSPEIGE